MTKKHRQATWNYPTFIRVGENSIDELAGFCSQLGMSRPLIVTDPGIAVLPMLKNIVNLTKKAGLTASVFSQIKSNPTGKNVEDGVSSFRQGKHDGIIAFGGGSALDAAKAIALMVGQDRPLWDFEDIGDNWTRVNTQGIAPVIAIPTTAGTGSEVGRASVITHEQQRVKKIIFHPSMLPEIVILDPMVTIGLPASITAATGMDALSHNLEAYCSSSYHPMAEGIALEGIRLVKDYLPQAYKDGTHVDARLQMLVASTMGATAFQRGLGAMHAVAHSLGALYDAHHGLLNAILMPYILTANKAVIQECIERLSRYLDLEDSSFDGFLAWILELRRSLNIPHSLSEIGITDQDSVLVGRMSECDATASGNPVAFSAQDYTSIFINAVRGKL